MTTLREAAQQALEALEQSETTVPYEGFGMAHREAERKHQAAITALRAALAQPVPHGCHVDQDHGVEPEGCVLDEGSPNKCIYAGRLLREGKDKTACKYWQPIEVTR